MYLDNHLPDRVTELPRCIFPILAIALLALCACSQSNNPPLTTTQIDPSVELILPSGNTREIDRVTTDGATPQYLGATPDLVFGPDQPRARAAIPPAPRPRPPGASLPRPAVQTIMAGRPFLATASRPAPNSRAVRHSPERFNAAGPWPDPLRTPPQARGRHRAGGRRELRPREHRRRLRRGRRGAQG